MSATISSQEDLIEYEQTIKTKVIIDNNQKTIMTLDTTNGKLLSYEKFDGSEVSKEYVDNLKGFYYYLSHG